MTDISEDIVPAIKSTNDLPHEISAEDFQKQLFSWFQDKGLMAELRSHLRVKMIGILKNASVECKVRNSFSPKLQAVNLLIAEYLLYKEYHYSLSVFSTEVPLTNEFQDYSIHTTRVKKYQFSESDMWDILEILGITSDSDEGKDVLGNYYKHDNTEPLLTCVIRTLHNTKQKSRVEIDVVTENKDHLLLKSITNLLIQAKLTPKYIADITEQFSLIIRTEIDRIDIQRQKECQQIKQKIRQDSRQRIDRCKQKVLDIEQAFESERIKLHAELNKRKADIQDCALQLQIRTDNLNEKEKMVASKEMDLVVQEDALVKKGELLGVKEGNLSEREDRLHTELQALYIEKIKLNDAKQKIRRISPHKTDISTLNKEQQTTQAHNIDNVLLKQTIRQLHLENDSLRTQIQQQNTHIDDLNQQTNNLTMQIVSLNKYTPSYKMAAHPPQQTNAGGDKHTRMRNSNYLNTSSSPLTSSCSSPPIDSPTEQILKAAKIRLMTLEQESREIERNFERYRTKPISDIYNNAVEGECDSRVGLVAKLNSNIAVVRENISRLMFDAGVDDVMTCTATPCAVEFRGDFSYNSLIADIPGSEYDMRPVDGDTSEFAVEMCPDNVEADVGAVMCVSE